MKVITNGHTYLVDIYDGEAHQEIKFVMRVGDGYPGNIFTQPGTNCQELIRVLIDRVQYLNNQIPCDENNKIIECFREALLLFECRAMQRHGNIEEIKTCKICGHIACSHVFGFRPD